ncbi:MAG: adenylyl-sulfate kinase [Verrucomicrobiaceae bacterium]|nr:adenylyl-sulfate kinase [Verrucomicrobiaceae bacterium]
MSGVVWIFGLPCAGKTTIGDALRDEFSRRSITALRLDGDQLRQGLCAGLGYSMEDRTENIRRAAHAARVAVTAGIPVIASLITPTQALRRMAGEIIGERFLPVFIDCPASECARRDVKGLYAKAKAGQLTALTGTDGAFERPEPGVLTLQTNEHTVAQCVEQVMGELVSREWLR